MASSSCAPFWVAVVPLTLLVGCGGNTGGPMGAGGSLLTGGTVGAGGDSGGSGGRFSGSGGVLVTGGTGGTIIEGTGGVPFVDAECPEEVPPPPKQDCDPFTRADECGDGLGCYPYLNYPSGDSRCGVPSFGAVCAPASSGAQGEPCGGDDQNYCLPGFLCVVGAGAGPRCAQLCATGASQCPSGLICTETDVQGFGVCF